MEFLKLTLVLGLACYAAAQGYGYGHGHGHGYHHDDHAVPTSYKFEYGVKDPHTHDFKSAWEHGDGHHNVKGAYELHEPDGSVRLVEYTAGPHIGFHAHVTKKGPYVHPHGTSYHNYNQY